MDSIAPFAFLPHLRAIAKNWACVCELSSWDEDSSKRVRWGWGTSPPDPDWGG